LRPFCLSFHCIAFAKPQSRMADLSFIPSAPVPMEGRSDPQTPKASLASRLPPQLSTPIRERGGNRRHRRMRRLPQGISVMEKPGLVQEDAETPAAKPVKRSAEDAMPDRETIKRRYTYRGLKKGSKKGAESDDEAALEEIPTGFGEEYFKAGNNAKALQAAVCRAAAKPLIPETLEDGATAPEPAVVGDSGRAWLGPMKLGFSLLLQGVGSKWRILESFADDVLLQWGAVVRINGFDGRISLAECLKEVIEQLFPKHIGRTPGSTVEAFANTIRSALRANQGPSRPVCFVVHNLECLPSAHQAALASLAAVPGFHLAASVDNFWAPLAWSSTCLRDFNFFREEVHTFESFDREYEYRFAKGPPAAYDPVSVRREAPKVSVGVVLRSLTGNHRELVQIMAEHQLARAGRVGLSQSKLLTMANDRMIVSTAPKLRTLLNELRDHEVVAERSGADGSTLLYLTCENKVLDRLAEGQVPDDSDDECAAGAEDDA